MTTAERAVDLEGAGWVIPAAPEGRPAAQDASRPLIEATTSIDGAAGRRLASTDPGLTHHG